MARNFPADTKLQSFYNERYNKEDMDRLQFWLKRNRGDAIAKPYQHFARQDKTVQGLPTINPMQYASNMVKEEKRRDAELAAMARQQRTKEMMRAPTTLDKDKLYEGFSHHGQGRSDYLKRRLHLSPEQKYTFPQCSSWDYGWKIAEQAQTVTPKNARTSLIKDSFYANNGSGGALPTVGMVRSYTVV